MENKEQKTFEPQSASGVAEKYAEILLQVKGLMEGVDNPVGVLANVAALLKEAFDYYFWVGFYVVRHGELQLGPFQGSFGLFQHQAWAWCLWHILGRGADADGVRRACVPRPYRLLLAVAIGDRRARHERWRGRSRHRCR